MGVSIHSRPSTVPPSEIIAVNTHNPVGSREQAAEYMAKYTTIQWEVMSRKPSAW